MTQGEREWVGHQPCDSHGCGVTSGREGVGGRQSCPRGYCMLPLLCVRADSPWVQRGSCSDVEASWRGCRRRSGCTHAEEGKEEEERTRGKIVIYSCSLTSGAKNEYFNGFSILHQIWHKVECPPVDRFIFGVRWQSNLTFRVHPTNFALLILWMS